MMPSRRWLSVAIAALTVAPIVSSVPVADPVPSIPEGNTNFQSGTDSDGATASSASASSSASAIATVLQTATADTMVEQDASATGLPSSLPTQKTWVEHILNFDPTDRAAVNALTYGFKEDGLDQASALTFSQVIVNEQSIYDKINATLADIQSKEVLIIALLAGAIAGFILCGVLYTVLICIRCCTKRETAKKRERDSFTMISPSSNKMSDTSKKDEKDQGSNRWPLDDTPIASRLPSSSNPRSEEMELADRFPRPGTLPTSTTAPSLTIPRRPTSPPPQLTLATSATFSHKPKSKSTSNPHASVGATSISDILAEFDFDVDEDAKERTSGESVSSSTTAADHNNGNGRSLTGNNNTNFNNDGRPHTSQGPGERQWPSTGSNSSNNSHYRSMGRTRGSDEGSQVGIVSGVPNKNMYVPRGTGTGSGSRGPSGGVGGFHGGPRRMSAGGWNGDRDGGRSGSGTGGSRSYRKGRMMHEQATRLR